MHPFFKTEIKWAVVLGALTLLWNVLERLTGFDSKFIELYKTSGYLFLIPFVLIYVLALMQMRLERGGELSYAQGLKSAFRIALYSVPFIILASYLKISFISPEFQENMIEYMLTTGANENDLRESFSTVPFLLKSAAYAMTGVVVGAVAMIFLKRP